MILKSNADELAVVAEEIGAEVIRAAEPREGGSQKVVDAIGGELGSGDVARRTAAVAGGAPQIRHSRGLFVKCALDEKRE